MSVYVCLPCYNEEKSLPPLLDHFSDLIGKESASFTLITVNDGSVDGTQSVLEDHATRLPIRIICHNGNRGLGPAILSGFQEALALAESDDDMVVCMDADDTHSPSYIPEMLDRIRAGADMVIASRYQPGSRQQGVPPFRRFLSAVARRLFSWFLPVPGVRDYTCGYRAYRVGLLRQAMAVFGDRLIERRGFACTDEILIKLSSLTERIEEIPFVLRYDLKGGQSALPLFTTALATLKLIYHGRRLRRQARHRARRVAGASDSTTDR